MMIIKNIQRKNVHKLNTLNEFLKLLISPRTRVKCFMSLPENIKKFCRKLRNL